jgi:hypothetical protein
VIDNSVKNRNQSTKILLHSFEDPSGQWEADGDDWYRWALPVYRMPQGSWAETTGFTRQKIWFIEKVFSEDPTNPNDIDFPPWVACYWDSQAGRWVVIKSGGGESLPPTEPNPGVVTVEITGESDCDGESFDDLGYHVFLATITSRPFGSPTEMRKERSGELTIFDPTGCMLDIAYDAAEFIGATAFVSLMYGGEIFDEEYNFKGGSGAGDDDVLTTDTYETFRPSTSCKPFGWVGGERTGYTASIGPIIPNGNTTFQVELPERGVYEVEITYGDATDATDNLITLSDGDRLLRTMTGTSEEGETWVVKDEYDFKSANRPLLKINLDNADDRDSRIVKLTIKQIDPPTQWEVINRCCIDADTAEA